MENCFLFHEVREDNQRRWATQPPAATPTALINQRRWALATLETALAVGFVKDAIAEGAWNVVKEREQPRVRNFWLLGLGTCCPCDVLSEGDYEDVGGEGDYEDVGDCTPTFGQVSEGIHAGYRFIDTASHYKYERSVGLAVVNAGAMLCFGARWRG
jgi:hypothetical protein